MENTIQLKKDNILRFEIETKEGNKTGEHLEFDLEDIELPLKLNECDLQHKKNVNYIKTQFIVIDKKEDKKGKYLLSWKEEEKIKLLKEFYEREIEALDLFLGKGGTRKLLNGRSPYWGMFDDINEYIEPIIPQLKGNVKNIADRIKSKYSKVEKDVLE